MPFTDVLSKKTIAPALDEIEACWKDCIYSPLVTLWVFLSQVISADHSCRTGVARLIAHRLSQGLEACSPRTGAYCQARGRLPERFFSVVTCLVGRALECQVAPKWLWQGRHVYMFDGSTVTMPDTPENQQAYPQVYNQKPGLGFPIARIGVITSLSCGAIVNLGFCRYAGKGQGETSLLRRMWNVLPLPQPPPLPEVRPAVGLVQATHHFDSAHLRSIKSTMQMDVLRCKTPELVRKEVWTHILAYNLIRTVMAQAHFGTTSSREQSASKAPCKHWRRFNH